MNTIDITTQGNTVVAQALRRLQKYAPFAFIRGLGMVWEWCDFTTYGATDGVKVYLNRDGLARLEKTSDPVGLTAFLLLHEVLHALLNHGVRGAKLADHDTFNRAADYVINAIIRIINKEARAKHGLTFDPFPLIDGVLDNPDLAGDHSAESLYQVLIAQQQKQQQQQPPVNVAPSNNGDDDPGDGMAGGDDGDGDSDDGDSDDGDGGSSKPKKSKPKKSKPSDDGDSDDGDSDGGDGDDSDDGDGGAGKSDADILGKDWVGTGSADTRKPDVDPGETLDDVSDKIEEAAEQAMLQQQINEAAGCNPAGMGGINAAIEQRARPQQGDWHYLVRNWFKARVEEGWLKPFNPQIYTSTGLVCPGRGRKKMGSVVILFDVSYSVPIPFVEEMLGEVQWFLDELKPESVVLAETTTHIGNTWELFPGESVPAKLKYGGGTCLKPGFDWVARTVPQCEGLIYMTDGESSDLKQIVMPEFPVMWLDWSGGRTKYPFGEVVVMNRK